MYPFCLTTDDTVRPQGIMPTMMLVQVELRKQTQIIKGASAIPSVIPLKTLPGARTIVSSSSTAHPRNPIDTVSTVRTDAVPYLSADHGTVRASEPEGGLDLRASTFERDTVCRPLHLVI